MQSFKPLPNNDKDRQLAEHIGQLLAKGRSMHDADDPLVDVLEEYRAQQQEQLRPQTGASKQTWRRLQPHLAASSELADQSTNITWLLNRPAWMYWTAAAAVVVMALVFALVMPFSPTTTMVAESGDQIVNQTLADGSRVQLRPNSRLYHVEQTDSRIVYRLKGEGYFRVVDQDTRQFQVQTKDALITVIGTRFNVSEWGGSTRVFLEEGKLRFSSRTKSQDEAVTLEPGQSSMIDFQGLPETPQVSSGQEYTDWMNNSLTFQNRSAHYVIQELEQHYHINIVTPDSVQNINLSGHILLDGTDKSLEDLGTVLNGRFEATGKRQYRFIPQ